MPPLLGSSEETSLTCEKFGLPESASAKSREAMLRVVMDALLCASKACASGTTPMRAGNWRSMGDSRTCWRSLSESAPLASFA